MRILALDIATHCGAAFLSDSDGEIRAFSGVWDLSPVKATKKRPASPFHHRETTLWNALMQALGTPGPDCQLVIEDSRGFHYKGKQAAEIAANLRGVVRTFCGLHNVAYFEIHPNALKKATTGKGNAGKALMVEYAKKELGLRSDNEDEADAVCLLDMFVRENHLGLYERWKSQIQSRL